MSKFSFKVNPLSKQLKYQQLVDSVTDAVSENKLQTGDVLPSVNQICEESNLSRDTVFKAYTELKNRGIIESVPNKGYFIANATLKVFLMLDTFKAYKEILYGALRDNLPENITVDLNFHHYNIKVFESIITDSIGKYSKYVIMNFNHPKVNSITKQIPHNKLLIIDWIINADEKVPVIYQNFGTALYNQLAANNQLIKKYQQFIYIYPPFTYHPEESVTWFEKFCTDYSIPFQIVKNSKKPEIKKDNVYLSVSDRVLAHILDQCHNQQLVPGTDIGIISYNETPMKKYIKEGITVISTDFVLMGKKIAEFIINGNPVHIEIPTQLILRKSL